MAVYTNLVIPRTIDHYGYVDMSLRAAEKARKASEIFIQRVNELIPEDPQKHHNDLLKGIDGKLALLKKNVAYLVLQNLSLIDKLVDAENTVHQVRNLHEIKNKWKHRPNTFAAPDTPTEKDFNTNYDRTKCESWYNPIIDFVIFNDNAQDLQSRKLSLTKKFVTNRLRRYLMREDMVNYLEPHLATYLFPNQYNDKDSDNDSGTGEEIVSPDELDNPSQTFDETDIASIVSSSPVNLVSTSLIANGNFTVSCSSGILAKKCDNKIIGIVQSVELESCPIESDSSRGMGTADKFDDEKETKISTMTEILPYRQNNSSSGKGLRRQGYVTNINAFSGKKANDGDINGQDESTTSQLIAYETNILKEPQVAEKKYKSNLNINVKVKTRYSIMHGSFEKHADTLNNQDKPETSNSLQIDENGTKGMRGKIKDQVTTIFKVKETSKTSDSDSNTTRLRQVQHNSAKLEQSTFIKNEYQQKTTLSKTDNSVNDSKICPRTYNQKSIGKPHIKENIYEHIKTLDKKTNVQQPGAIDIIREQSDPDKRKNFSSKVSRGNKLRKSKRVQAYHQIFELKKQESTSKETAMPIETKYTVRAKQPALSRIENSQGDLSGP